MTCDADILIPLIECMLEKKHYNEVKNLINEYKNAQYDMEMLQDMLKDKMAPADIMKMVGGGKTKTSSTRFSKRN